MRLVEARLRSKSDSWSQAFLTETVKTGAKYRNVSYKIFKRCRPFRERVGPPSNSIVLKALITLPLASVDEQNFRDTSMVRLTDRVL